MNRARSTAAAAIVATLTAGCLPSRSNGNDPVNAPEVEVKAVTWAPDAVGACPLVSSSAALTESVSRGRCLAFDASATRDRHGDPIDASRFHWSIAAPEDVAALDGLPALPDGDVLIVPESLRRLPALANRRLELSLRVKDREGNTGRATAGVIVQNAAPIARTSGIRSLPAGGWDWAPGAPVVTRFSGAPSSDADGDGLTQWCWTFPGEAETCAPNPVLDHAVPSARGRVVVTLVVDDGAARSEPVSSVIDFDVPPIWLGSANGNRLERLDAGEYSIGVASTVATIAAIRGDGAAGGLLTGGYGTVATSPLGGPGALLDMPLPGADGGIVYVTTADDGLSGWALQAGGLWRLDIGAGPSFDVTATSVPFPAGLPVAGAFIPADRTYRVATGDGGELWVASREASSLLGGPAGEPGTVVRVTPQGAGLTVLQDPSLDPTSLVRRPGSDEMWMTTIAHPEDGTPPSVPYLYVFAGDGSTLETLAVGSNGAASLAFVDHETAWLSLPGDGVRLIDVPALLGETVEAATILRVPQPASLVDLVADPDTGVCMGVRRDSIEGGASAVLEITPSGGVRIESGLGGITDPVFNVLVDGRRFVTTILDLLVTRTPFSDHRVFADSFGGAQFAATDPKTGGLYAAVRDPANGIVHFAADGTMLDLWTYAVRDGSTIAMPAFQGLRVSVDGEHVWGRTSGAETVELDLDPSAAVIRTVTRDVLEWSAGVDPPFAWAEQGSSVGVVDSADDATLDPAITLPVGETVDSAALVPASSDLCVVSSTGPTGPSHRRRLRRPGTGAPDDLGDIPYLPGQSAGVFVGASGDECWFVESVYDAGYEGRVTVFSADGGLERSYVFRNLGRFQGFRPLAGARLAAETYDPDVSVALLVLAELPPAVGASSGAFVVTAPSDSLLQLVR